MDCSNKNEKANKKSKMVQGIYRMVLRYEHKRGEKEMELYRDPGGGGRGGGGGGGGSTLSNFQYTGTARKKNGPNRI